MDLRINDRIILQPGRFNAMIAPPDLFLKGINDNPVIGRYTTLLIGGNFSRLLNGITRTSPIGLPTIPGETRFRDTERPTAGRATEPLSSGLRFRTPVPVRKKWPAMRTWRASSLSRHGGKRAVTERHGGD